MVIRPKSLIILMLTSLPAKLATFSGNKQYNEVHWTLRTTEKRIKTFSSCLFLLKHKTASLFLSVAIILVFSLFTTITSNSTKAHNYKWWIFFSAFSSKLVWISFLMHFLHHKKLPLFNCSIVCARTTGWMNTKQERKENATHVNVHYAVTVIKGLWLAAYSELKVVNFKDFIFVTTYTELQSASKTYKILKSLEEIMSLKLRTKIH